VQDCLDEYWLLNKVLFPGLDEAPAALDHGNLDAHDITVDADCNNWEHFEELRGMGRCR
jgi:hypothetical protein